MPSRSASRTRLDARVAIRTGRARSIGPPEPSARRLVPRSRRDVECHRAGLRSRYCRLRLGRYLDALGLRCEPSARQAPPVPPASRSEAVVRPPHRARDRQARAFGLTSARKSEQRTGDELRLAQRQVVVGVELDVARVRRRSRATSGPISRMPGGSCLAVITSVGTASSPSRSFAGAPAGASGSTPSGSGFASGVACHSCADPLVGAERRPDLEVDRHRRVQVAFGLGRASYARALLLGVRRAVVAGQRRRDADERPAALGMRERGVEGDPAAEREADERRALDAELVEHADDVVLPRPRRGRAGRAAEEAEVGADRPEALREERDDRLPQARVAEPAVEQETAGPLPASSYQSRAPFTPTVGMPRRIASSRHGLRARSRRRRRPDGRRNRAGRRGVRPPRLALRRRTRARPSAGSPTMRKSLERLAEKGGADPDEVLARVAPADELVAGRPA